MKREHSNLLVLATVLCLSLWGCVSTLTWKVEPINKVVKTEQVKVEQVKKDTVKTEQKKKRIDVIRDTENGQWDRMIPPIK